MENRDATERLYWLLPDYVAGTLWAIDLVCMVALARTHSDAVAAAKRWAELLRPFNFPEIAVGFLLIVGGILLPYALAMALDPLTSIVITTAFKRWYLNQESEYFLSEHFKVGRDEISTLIGTVPPKMNQAIVLRAALEHLGSSATTRLHRQYHSLYMQLAVMLPASLLVALTVYAVFGQTTMGVAAAIVTGIAILAMMIRDASRTSKRLDELVLFTYLAVKGLTKDSLSTKFVTDGSNLPGSA
jgi:hypothetical protein